MNTKDDIAYGEIANAIDYSNPSEFLDPLRALSKSGHADSMNLLAIVLGDIDDRLHRDEIVSLYTKAHELGSLVAKENLEISMKKWRDEVSGGHAE